MKAAIGELGSRPSAESVELWGTLTQQLKKLHQHRTPCPCDLENGHGRDVAAASNMA
jgi:hypothetical protein